MLVLEALRAKFGDALLLHFGTKTKPGLIVVDGGPPGVWSDALRRRLGELRSERGLADGEPLEIDLAMVSHIDNDHIAGLLEMMRETQRREDDGEPPLWRCHRFWHNSFDDLLGNDDLAVATAASAMSPASLGGALDLGSDLLASVPQGRELRKLLAALGLDGNPPVGGLLLNRKKPIPLAGLKLHVVAPLEENLRELQDDWNEKIRPLLAKEKAKKTKAGRAAIAAFLDESVYNLSSLVVLVEAGKRRLLLTGDARGDHTLAGLEKSGFLKKKGKLALDLLKVPHHGSDRNVDEEYFRRLPARHYVISADGKHENPDVATLKMISAARPDDKFTVHLTYPTDEFAVKEIGARVAKFFAMERKKGRKYGVVTRGKGDLGVEVKVG